MKPRYPFLDSLRGFALLLMIGFHFCFDLREVGLATFNLQDPFWVSYRTLILLLFLSLVGVNFYLAAPDYSSPTFRKRVIQLGLCALMITAATKILFPQAWVFFGVLHLILFASLLAPLLRRVPWICLGAGLVLLALPWFVKTAALNSPLLAISGLSIERPRTIDFDPLCPWLGLVLLGVFLGRLLQGNPSRWLAKEIPFLSRLGRHTLLVYMVHQAILLPIAWCLAKLF